MPELPEVETTVLGIRSQVIKKEVRDIIVRQSILRWPVQTEILKKNIIGKPFYSVKRRAKYLILENENGSLIIHLGMSGNLRVIDSNISPNKHDHIDILFQDSTILRYYDPRRFGSFHWAKNPLLHPLIINLGPEPLSNDFSGKYLFDRSRKRKQSVKNFIMDGKIVSGIGNIYASEVLFEAGIKPSKSAGSISLKLYISLVESIRKILKNSIKKGGTTLRDFVNIENKPGYFKQQLKVYGREGKECRKCKNLLKQMIIGQRSTVYCPKCQTY